VASRASATAGSVVEVLETPEPHTEYLDAINNPENPDAGTRKVPFSRELYIEREDFMEVPEKKFFRLAPGVEVRLRYAYYITCNEVVKDENGNIIELRCTYDPQTKGGGSPDGRKVKATLHWVSANHAVDAEVRLFDRLFSVADPENFESVSVETHNCASLPCASLPKTFIDNLNPNSLQVLKNCKIEPFIKETKPLDHFQFERLGYFVTDKESTPEHLVFNRTVSLKDSK